MKKKTHLCHPNWLFNLSLGHLKNNLMCVIHKIFLRLYFVKKFKPMTWFYVVFGVLVLRYSDVVSISFVFFKLKMWEN